MRASGVVTRILYRPSGHCRPRHFFRGQCSWADSLGRGPGRARAETHLGEGAKVSTRPLHATTRSGHALLTTLESTRTRPTHQHSKQVLCALGRERCSLRTARPLHMLVRSPHAPRHRPAPPNNHMRPLRRRAHTSNALRPSPHPQRTTPTRPARPSVRSEAAAQVFRLLQRVKRGVNTLASERWSCVTSRLQLALEDGPLLGRQLLRLKRLVLGCRGARVARLERHVGGGQRERHRRAAAVGREEVRAGLQGDAAASHWCGAEGGGAEQARRSRVVGAGGRHASSTRRHSGAAGGKCARACL